MAAVKIPERLGEGLAGVSRAGASRTVGLADVANSLAQDVRDGATDTNAIAAALAAAADFAAFKAAVGALSLKAVANCTQKSDDSRI